jgi:hypothetical protein
MSGQRQSLALAALSGGIVLGLALSVAAVMTSCAVDDDGPDEDVLEASANPGRGTGRASWTGTNRNGSTFTVLAEMNDGVANEVAVRGTPPSVAELPRTLTNANGGVLRITAGPTSASRHYEGKFKILIDNSVAYGCTHCACIGDKCIMNGDNSNCYPAGISCYQVPCLGGGGGVEPLDAGFTASIPTPL